jgi:glycosyltransferase involved in cell wall biosynthesis
LVVPFYNPGPALRPTVERAVAALRSAGLAFEVVAVCDGATDGSEATLEGVAPGVVRTVCYRPNRGKGFAVRTGMAQGTGRLIGFIDADGDIPPEILPELVARAHETGADIVYGSKRAREATPHVPWLRRTASSGYRLLVGALFDLDVPDTQTGVKLLRAELARALVATMREERFAFDLEMFVLARRLGYHAFVEVPVRVDKRYTSTVSFREARSILVDTLKLFFRFRFWPSQPREGEAPDRRSRVPQKDVDPG